jgi:hypothetical protein
MHKADLIKQELEALAEANNGLLKAETVVEFAKDPTTALHARFEWDDTEAAAKYRVWQARQLIKVTVDVLPNENETVYQVFVSLKDDRRNGGGYRPMVEVMSDENMRKQLLAQAANDFRLWQRKYQQLKELAPVFAQMELVLEQTQAEPVAA